MNSLQEVVIQSQDSIGDRIYCIGENSYKTYCSLDKAGVTYGDAVAYYINDDHFCYFLKVDGLPEGNWVVLFTDWSNRAAEYTLLKNIDTTQIPKWVEAISFSEKK